MNLWCHAKARGRSQKICRKNKTAKRKADVHCPSRRTGPNKGHDPRSLQCLCGLVGCHLRRKVFEFAVSHETHKPKVGIYIR